MSDQDQDQTAEESSAKPKEVKHVLARSQETRSSEGDKKPPQKPPPQDDTLLLHAVTRPGDDKEDG